MMSHSPTTHAIELYAKESLQRNDPMYFLQKFAPLHKRWHTTSLRNNIGFLLFHWFAIKGLKKSHADKIWPGAIKPFTLADWQGFQWPYTLNINVTSGSFSKLGDFSSRIENWHNEAHMAVETATGENMMDPLTNIYLKNFWRLHYFINARFVEALKAFDGKDSADKQVARLIKKYEGSLGDI
jgi:hypothetical protein